MIQGPIYEVIQAGLRVVSGAMLVKAPRPWPMPVWQVTLQPAGLGGPWNRHGTRMRDESETGSKFDPEKLIAAISQRQDRAAFAELFRFYAPRVKAMLMRAGATAEVAEDVAQDALLTVWRKAAQFDPSRASPAAWIYTIARNLRIDRLRQHKRAKRLELYELGARDPADRPDDLYESSQRNAHVRDALAGLPDEQICVVQLSFVEGRSHGDIAKLLDLPLGTVKSRLRLALKRLRPLLGELS